MNNRKKYVGGTFALFGLLFLLTSLISPEIRRYEQHRSYNTEIEDTCLSTDPESFSSKLPVITVDTAGQEIPGRPKPGERAHDQEDTMIRAQVQIRETEGTLHRLSDEPELDSGAEIRVRGNSSRWFEKTGYLLKFLKEDGTESKYSIMGMEPESTWVLHGPYLDKTMMRNYMWYNLSGQIMEWAPDVRFCELFLNGSYQGIYVMTEHIDVAEGRLDLTRYDNRARICSYIVCADRENPFHSTYLDNFSWYTLKSESRLEVKYPGKNKITPELAEYISRDFSEFEKALYSYDYDSRRYGYRNYIDTGNFVDYFLINEMAMNIDAGLYSTYFYKDVSGKLKLAVWDFNNCVDNYQENTTPVEGFFMTERPWFYMLVKDEAFTERVIMRYHSLRRGLFSDEALTTYIDDVADYLGSAIARNNQVWGSSFLPLRDPILDPERKIGSFEEAMDQYKSTLLARLDWLDKNIEMLRSYSHDSLNKEYNH